MNEPGAYLRALRAAGLIESVIQPETLTDLSDSLAAAEHFIVLGRGTSGAVRPEVPVTAIRLSGLPSAPVVDVLSQTVRVPAWWTWRSVEAFAAKSGLTLGGLVDVWPERSVGGTLATPEILQALWMSNTARSACVGLSAVMRDGAEYQHITSPRTASGPDLRAVFLGTVGRVGAIVRVTLRAEPADELRWLKGPVHRGLQPLLSEFGSVLAARGAQGVVYARVRWGTRLGTRAVESLKRLGFISAERTPYEPPPPLVATVPWDEVDRVDALASAEPLAFGPTHVAFGLPVTADEVVLDSVRGNPLCSVLGFSPEALG